MVSLSAFLIFMLLTVDIGNTATKFAVFKGEELVDRIRITTERRDSYKDVLERAETLAECGFEGVAVSSVVRELRSTYSDLATEHFGCESVFVDHTFDLGFSIRYEPPADCGPDRLVAAYAAVKKAGTPVIVCDFGTATTIDFVNKDNEYRGGIITPGIETMSNSLFEKTSRLPKVKIGPPASVVGSSTVDSIRSGIYFGYIGLVDGIIRRMQDEAGYEIPVISTGGYAEMISTESEFVEMIDKDLIHHGLHGIWAGLNR